MTGNDDSRALLRLQHHCRLVQRARQYLAADMHDIGGPSTPFVGQLAYRPYARPPEQRKIASRQAGENHGARKHQRLRNLAEQQITEIVAIERAEENQRHFLRMTNRDVHGSESAQFDQGNNCAALAMARRILFQCKPRQYTRWHPSQYQNSSNTAPVRGGSRLITASFATPRSGRLHSRQRPDAGREKSSE